MADVSGIGEILDREFRENGEVLTAVIVGCTAEGNPQHIEIAPFKNYDMELLLRPYAEFNAELTERVSWRGDFEIEGIPEVKQERHEVTQEMYDADLYALKTSTYWELEKLLEIKQDSGRYALLKKSVTDKSTNWCDADCGRLIRPGFERYKFVAFGRNDLNFLYELNETGLYMLRPTAGRDQPELAKIKVADLKFTAPSE